MLATRGFSPVPTESSINEMNFYFSPQLSREGPRGLYDIAKSQLGATAPFPKHLAQVSTACRRTSQRPIFVQLLLALLDVHEVLRQHLQLRQPCG